MFYLEYYAQKLDLTSRILHYLEKGLSAGWACVFQPPAWTGVCCGQFLHSMLFQALSGAQLESLQQCVNQ